MGEKRQIIPAGALFLVTSGVYSDFGVMGVFRALREIDADAMRDAYFDERPEARQDRYPSEYEFLGWLTRHAGLMEEVPCHDWHLGDYGINDDGFDVTGPGEWADGFPPA